MVYKKKDGPITICLNICDNTIVNCFNHYNIPVKSIPQNSEYIKPNDYHPDQYSTLRKQWYKKKMYRKYGLVYTLEDIISTK